MASRIPSGFLAYVSAPSPKRMYWYSSGIPNCWNSWGSRANARPAWIAPSTVRDPIVTTRTSQNSPANGVKFPV